MKCPREHCGGFLEYQAGYIVYGQGMGRIHSEDKIVCLSCGRHRYLTEQETTPSPKGRTEALPVEVLALAPPEAVRRARRYTHGKQEYYRQDDSQEEYESDDR